jgi:hypothetical protein
MPAPLVVPGLKPPDHLQANLLPGPQPHRPTPAARLAHDTEPLRRRSAAASPHRHRLGSHRQPGQPLAIGSCAPATTAPSRPRCATTPATPPELRLAITSHEPDNPALCRGPASPPTSQVRASSVGHRRRSPHSGAALGPRPLPKQLSTGASNSSLPGRSWRQSAGRSSFAAVTRSGRWSPGRRLVPSTPPMAPMAKLRRPQGRSVGPGRWLCLTGGCVRGTGRGGLKPERDVGRLHGLVHDR